MQGKDMLTFIQNETVSSEWANELGKVTSQML